MALTVVTPPAEEPITLAEAKAQCRIDSDDEDALLTGYIRAARRVAERISRRALITQTLELVLDGFPAHREIELPRPPLQSVVSVTYTDRDENEHALDSGSYLVDADSEPGRIVLKSGYSWPSDTLQSANGVRVRFVAGYGGAEDVPEEYKLGVKLLVGHYYENRENAMTSGAVPQEIPDGARSLFAGEKVWAF